MATGKQSITSTDSPIILNPVCSTGKGTLYLTFAPGKKQQRGKFTKSGWSRDLDLDLARIKDIYKITDVVCLLEDSELVSLQIPNYREKVKEYGLELIEYPIKDRSVPKDIGSFHDLVMTIRRKISVDRNVMVHCVGGLGRSGTVGAGVLCSAGMSADIAISTTRKHRPNALNSRCQEIFIKQYADTNYN